MTTIHDADWWEAEKSPTIRCVLCPRRCLIKPGETGFCGVRFNGDGRLLTIAYGYPVAINIDPIEKKPLARFMGGTRTFSFGTFGCNLNCSFCQNDSLSRGHYQLRQLPQYVTPGQIVEQAQQHKCSSVSYTYNEPTVFAEYVRDTAKVAAAAGLKNVMVSNGYISLEAAQEIYPLMDAANIDMKGFSEDFYRKICGASLKDVLNSIEYFYQLGKHLELTNLVIPGYNDDAALIDAWLDWVEEHLDKNVPLHFSAYHPAHKMAAPPTPVKTVLKIRDRALERGFQYVFTGNI
ncbi:MAG: AmmeMemoRadiSam system radical SAM enzyme [Victivallaceae bacterium]|nr:AmmeMemoRadiSam system radical SAM enzyme [Victivallaceae bacterium]MDD3702849.1 AmmeMemoRadiSam system radical SAM enzyme [Victivallaceae bacterium]MDD4317781.1 AmmeMemoRadiSam system radical SAM enzyme [Victivallaceae bacterium]MDD5664490.1 AmmeMemoRadiSam system radical SAM enzyme [Victivallaceae bacterium]NLK83374.1 AmmeMemoRadiSam system radical SAM enzyme [Lentisphaerota bacterium]